MNHLCFSCEHGIADSKDNTDKNRYDLVCSFGDPKEVKLFKPENGERVCTIGTCSAFYPICSAHGKACRSSLHSHDGRNPVLFYCDESCQIGDCRHD